MIDVHNVHFTYPNGIEALKGISLTIEDGDFVAIMGENGAGKTTLVKHFNGLLKPTKGRVIVHEECTKDVSVATLARKVGFVFQNPDHQLFSETVEEEIGFALKNFGYEKNTIERRVSWALGLLGLTQYRKTSPFMLSGGERKRVALASVLAWNPETLIMDEPTIGQDYQQKEKLLQFILQMKSQKKTIIIVTHDVEFVAECAPRIILMTHGTIIADGDGKEVLTNPDVLSEASIVPPQITQIFTRLTNFDLPKDVIDVYDAREKLMKVLQGSR